MLRPLKEFCDGISRAGTEVRSRVKVLPFLQLGSITESRFPTAPKLDRGVDEISGVSAAQAIYMPKQFSRGSV